MVMHPIAYDTGIIYIYAQYKAMWRKTSQIMLIEKRY